jgi:MFS superfamily sulfate permease-like transporter
MKSNLIQKLFPFLAWFPMSRETLRADLVAGITVTLILVPQSMAYAQLAGLPVVYGLYAAFIPVIVASLWGSLRQLHTGPTAMLALMSAAALLPHATPGSNDFIQLSIMLALLVGVLRLVLGLFRLGLIVNFLSLPVVIGFTNAAALIIGLSQLNKLINVPMPRSDVFLADLWVVLQQLGTAHWPTLLFGLTAFAIIFGLQKRAPRLPAILIAILVTTPVSWLIGFERSTQVPMSAIQDEALRWDIQSYADVKQRIQGTSDEVTRFQAALTRLEEGGEANVFQRIETKAMLERAKAELAQARAEQARLQVQLHLVDLAAETGSDGQTRYVLAGLRPEGQPLGLGHWSVAGLKDGQVQLNGGGEVVGAIPSGLPTPELPPVKWELVLPLLPAALIMALLGFMEATSITQAIVAKTRQRVDINRELVGQGLANIVGSFFQAFVVSGSFSRSAVAARVGAKTGLFAIFSALGVLLAILFLTPLLYHLPQAVLAVIIMLAVFGLIRFKALLEAWRVNRADALVGWLTFFATLAMAPALANGILLGVGLTVLLFMVRSMRPRSDILGRNSDGSLGGVDSNGLESLGDGFVALRFDGSLNFVNAAHFEESVLAAQARFPQARALLIVGNGINDIDVSGQEKVRALAQRLAESGVELYFSSLKRQVRAVFEQPALTEAIPADHVFKTKEQALTALETRYGSAARAATIATGEHKA